MMDHERLDVYRCSIEFVAAALPLVASAPRGYGALIDQLRRAAVSIPLNIAEGTGKVSPRDRANYYAIARGSSLECGAILDVFARVKADIDTRHPKDLLERIVSMLSKMCR